MKDKLLSLCKRLRNATHDELLSFMEIEEDVLDRMLLFLIEEGKIEKSGDTYHFLKSSIPERSRIKRQNKNLFLMFQYHSPETIELIIKSFWVTAWRDYKSGKWLGWILQCGHPNSDHIFQSFYYAVEKYGLITL